MSVFIRMKEVEFGAYDQSQTCQVLAAEWNILQTSTKL